MIALKSYFSTSNFIYLTKYASVPTSLSESPAIKASFNL